MELEALKQKTILVTGGSGFIGTALVRALHELGADVHGVSRKPAEQVKDVAWHTGDLSDQFFADELIREVKPDFVFHLAGHVVGSRDISVVFPTLKSNLITTVNMLYALNKYGCERMIFSGSLEEPQGGEENLIPSSPYAASKFAASNYCKMFHELYQFPVAIARIHMGYGPGMQDMNKLLPYLILTTRKGETPKLSSGTRELDWIYIDDIVSGLVQMMLADGIDGETIDIGTGKLTSIKKITELTVKLVDDHIKPEFGAIEDRPLEQESRTDIEETYKKIGWKAKTDLEEGLKKMVSAFSGKKPEQE